MEQLKALDAKSSFLKDQQFKGIFSLILLLLITYWHASITREGVKKVHNRMSW